MKYGEDERNVFDIWLAESEKPTPLAVYIHGGGFKSGSKEKLKTETVRMRYSRPEFLWLLSTIVLSQQTLCQPPIMIARRAIQFIRSKAGEWNIDTDRVAAFGGSAGAQICMWLAYSDDMADTTSNDPVERESTRLLCVATVGGQTSAERDFYIDNILATDG